MVTELKEFQKTKDYLICVDSDGCAMDTMDLKHKNCFGPCMIRLWGLEKHEKEIQDYWNQVNLYRMSRGINRFLGLYMVLEYASREYPDLETGDIAPLKKWINGKGPFSNDALKAEIEFAEKNNEKAEVLKMALTWSEQVNQSIRELPKEAAKAFEGVKEVLSYLHTFADIAVVSSANQGAVEEEWKRCGLYPHVDGLFTQNAGSKKHCLAELSNQGYKKCHMLMVGDAPGDMAAAKDNGILFYPILVRKEAESWKKLKDFFAEAFSDGSYGNSWQEKLNQEFKANLSDKK